MAKAPTGYDRGDDGRLVPNGDAPAIAEAFRLRGRGANLSEVARLLDERGVRPPPVRPQGPLVVVERTRAARQPRLPRRDQRRGRRQRASAPADRHVGRVRGGAEGPRAQRHPIGRHERAARGNPALRILPTRAEGEDDHRQQREGVPLLPHPRVAARALRPRRSTQRLPSRTSRGFCSTGARRRAPTGPSS